MNESEFIHQPVLLRQTVEALQPRNDGVYVDGTLGGGGHTRALLDASRPGGRVIAFDQDQEAIANAERWRKTYGDRLHLIHDNFKAVKTHLTELGIGAVDGMLFDLGVSSPQLDEAERGFSYNHDAVLDMRMDHRQERSAATLLGTLSERELTAIFREYGEEKWASRIASFIVRERTTRAITTTGQLVELIKAAVPAAARRTGPHPAKRVFQALRIAVNDELGALEELLKQIPACLRGSARAAIITFHSLEDRMVKQQFAQYARDCVCPPHAPQCTCGHRAAMRVITRKPILPDERELAANARARSAKLRVAERL